VIDFGLRNAVKILECLFTATSRCLLASVTTVLGAEDDKHLNKYTSCACDDDNKRYVEKMSSLLSLSSF